MKALLRSRFLALAVMVLAVPASAGPFEDGLTAYEREDYATALKFWRPLAEQGHAGVQYNLGIMYEDGLGVPQDDAEVVKWYRMAAEQGVAKAQASLGFMYAKGRGVEQDDTKAIKWYRKAAEQGLDRAQYNLGLMYAMGRGVSRDTVKAHMWFTIAATQGVELAKRGRDLAANKLTPDQIAEAERLTREWMAKHQR